MDEFSKDFSVEIMDLISNLLRIQHKRAEENTMYSDENLNNSYLFFPAKSDLRNIIACLNQQIVGILDILEDE